ncbi:MAG: undecaprenyl-diphosphate phosphatase, partial [Bdellovibrionales bacterium]
MKDVTILDAIILGIVEGLTEYLPVSSTGHLMVTSALLKLEKTEFLKSFEIVIQSGAILSVLLIYRDRFFGQFNISFYKKIFWAFLPTALVGLILKKLFDHMLGSIWIVAATLIVGGFFLIWMEKQKWFSKNHKSIEDLTLKDCIKLGLFQCVAMLPGTSRSGASIVGGLFLGLKKEEATQFSFFLAVPTLLGASVLKFKDILPYLNKDNA